MFLSSASGVLTGVKRIFSVELDDKSTRCLAVMWDNELVELERSYTIEAIRRVLDPVRSSR
jgi:hypothetical protein